MKSLEEATREAIRKNAERYRRIIIDALNEEKEEQVMKVSYNGFTGELVKIEAVGLCHDKDFKGFQGHDLSIYDSDKRVTHSFTGVKLGDVKFLGGSVSFDG